MTSSATRRKARREATRERLSEQRETYADSFYGIEVRQLKDANVCMRVTWRVERDPFYALIGLAKLRAGVLAGLEAEMVEECRRNGLSWDDIGFALDLSAEAVRKRHRGHDPA